MSDPAAPAHPGSPEELGSSSPAPADLGLTLPSRPPHREPERIGPYRILQTIGEGGMGIVYQAEQREPIRRIVVLKVIKLGMDTREVVARFEAERQALAMLSHPTSPACSTPA
jgi:serine/threonine protein kinase